MWVTCYTDASYSVDRGGAWAVWLRSDLGRVVRTGACPAYVRSADLAELTAIYAAIYLAVGRWGARVRGIRVRSDSQNALMLTAGDSKLSPRPHARRLQLKIRALLAKHGLGVECKWVKGHQPKRNGTAAWLNRQCDKLAGSKRRALPASLPAKSPDLNLASR